MLILFDLDGTLTESAPGITRSIEYALKKQGFRDYTFEQLLSCVGPPLYDSFRSLWNMTEDQVERAVHDFRDRYETTGIFENKPYPGILEMLQKLNEAGILCGVASSKPEPFVRRILDHFHLTEYLPVVAGATEDETIVEKPDIIRMALKTVKEKNPDSMKSGVFMAGDRCYDIHGAKSCGIHSIGTSYGYGSREELENAGAEYIVDTTEELGNLILSLDAGMASA